MRLDALKQQLRRRLHDSESAALDTELLLCRVLGKPRSFLLTWPEFEPDEAQMAALEALVQRRLQGEPMAHILGEKEFWSLSLEVSADTLIPRPDTETLVEAALARLPDRPATLVDLGTGTGAIALALKSERPQDRILAVEFNPEAAALARRNSARLGLPIEVRQGSWFAPLTGCRFDMIVSNPPYIDAADPHLNAGDVRFEPASALVAGQQGMADLVTLITQAPDFLRPGGWLLLEHGWTQGAAVRQRLIGQGYQQVGSLRDLGGQERVTLGLWPGEELC
ncbi:peptide chain release factor N(5)-glutamine methyltransferase [Zobellella maritima]|uniref:peptide chain release factor N(5)-glutamine methyltransferase n=1 Tax=Zobellella maritima TaxID=2059725 RepID=UPI000E302E16|nr:peptide chain release factor N(5)-glutamine methyltransferase [Zobellella maritima]